MLCDHLLSQSGCPLRLLLHGLQRPYKTVSISLFEGEGKEGDFLAKNPTGGVPLDDFAHATTWSSRVRGQAGFLHKVYPDSIDLDSSPGFS